jgi:hypothetical protein
MSTHDKVVKEFRDFHERLNHIGTGCQFFSSICPICDIIVREQTDVYPTAIEEAVWSIVQRYWSRWQRDGYRIAQNLTAAEELCASLSFDVFARWIQPKYKDIPELEDEELIHHRYVIQKLTR